MIEAELQARLRDTLGSDITLSPIGSGQLGPIYRLQAATETYLLKTSPKPRFLEVEARMLRDLQANGIAVPDVISVDASHLLMRYVPSLSVATEAFETNVAQTLLKLHAISNDAHMYGYYYDTPIASFWQCNEQTHYHWALFYGQMRVMPMAREAYDRGVLSRSIVARLEKLCDKLYTRIDMSRITPSLLHGDLWSGNVISAKDGAVLIDPAIYFGDREVELAFIAMFHAFGERFWQTYTAHHPLSEDYYETKEPLYQLYPYLVHIALYGEGYVRGLTRCLERLKV